MCSLGKHCLPEMERHKSGTKIKDWLRVAEEKKREKEGLPPGRNIGFNYWVRNHREAIFVHAA